MQYNNTWGPRYGKWGEWDANFLYPVIHNLTFEFDSTEWFNRGDVSVIGGYPWALTLHTNKRQLPTCDVPGIRGHSNCIQINVNYRRLASLPLNRTLREAKDCWGLRATPAVGWIGFNLSSLISKFRVPVNSYPSQLAR
ncbi:hypothetical protein DPMN_033067 [Dreissena polymorpha]|uniref:Uncharacterized protein n=1 Tax=Dreissena polymorpha TaxID=45954 RepID=A0A9D4RJI2_DREPO|nr:hypothetical protein DPMN_033067 [Dreissena polymorpha]